MNEQYTKLNDAVQADKAQDKKRAKIVLLIILIALVVVLALVSVVSALGEGFGKKGIFSDPSKNIVYDEPDYHSNIWQDGEYMKHAYGAMAVNVCADGFITEKFAFGDEESALEAFEKAKNYEDGAAALSDYFYALLCGSDSPGEQKRFETLFCSEYRVSGKINGSVATFPPQKIYDLYFSYEGTALCYDEQTSCHKWKVSYKIVKNDGTVLNYSSGKDSGEAYFYVEETGRDQFAIKEIVGIYRVN
ncbi:MAG: hypothetical protein IJX08_01155 [Clostridia bacterium]|nr:hypothetical protein [Clostridia bacterium]